MLIPDSAHGTNPASVSLAGYRTVSLPSDGRGLVSPATLRRHLDDDVAGIMLTNPNTLGLFEEDIAELAGAVHEAGGLVYYDGANLNAILGVTRPGDMGFDIVHLTCTRLSPSPMEAAAQGRGRWPSPSALCRSARPLPRRLDDGNFVWEQPARSIGRVHGWHGNALAWPGPGLTSWPTAADGLQRVSEAAVLNANWLLSRLREVYAVPFDRPAMHEVVVSTRGARLRCRCTGPGCGQKASGQGLPRADGVLPAGGARGTHDRAHRDREPRDGGGPGRGPGGDSRRQP